MRTLRQRKEAFEVPFYIAFDWTWLLLIPALIISAVAQGKVSSTYNKYSQVQLRRRVSGSAFADEMLRSNGVSVASVNKVSGNLTDHYDPVKDTVNLSEGVYTGTSVAAVAVAAHECGHVLQKKTGYKPMSVRHALVPVVNVCSNLSLPLILIGMFLGVGQLASIGVWTYFAVVIFQIATLPVEFNASKRALASISASGGFTEAERAGAKEMLSAAAMTYVAGTLSSFMSFLRLFILSRLGRRR